MSTTTDTFARFVDVLAETLDDHSLSGEELASRMHLSRFAAHRRTLVCGALVDAGIGDLGAGDPMGWVAEHA
jgi:hypothetical protein